jgi:hypothetical protein
MTLQAQLIAPFATGLDTDMEPWLMPADAFTEADNVHVHHGYIEKRSGYALFGTLSQALRVMGILRYIQSDGSKATLAFDVSRAYLYDTVSNTFSILDAAPIMDCGVYDYIWGANWQSSNVVNRLYFTNGLAYDGISLNGIRFFTTTTPTITTLFIPSTGGGNTLYGAKLIFTLASRLIVLGTFENDGGNTTYHPQRARWCAKQDPSNWNDVVAGGGDFADAATGDQIISAQALQNQIIVFFTNSVWALLPTSDPNKAFRWVRLNSFRACDGKMASVAYDRYSKALGIRGITATDGTETQRIDQRIQKFTINNINFNEFGKVFCQRSFENQRWWTLYPAEESTENNKALIFDDDSSAYTTYSINLNCLGYANSGRDYGLNDFSVANNLDYSIDEMGDDNLQDWYWDENQDLLVAGDLVGNIYQLELGAEDIEEPINSEIFSAGWNPFQKEGLESQMSYVDFYVDTDRETNGTVEFYKNDEENPYASQRIQFLPNLNYVAAINQISQTNPCLVDVAQHGLSTGQTIYIYGVDGMQAINSGNGYVITVVDENSFTLNGIDATAYPAYTGDGSVYLKQFYQTKTWIRAFGGGIGYLHRVRLLLTGGERPFRIHAFKPYFKPRGRRTVN